MKSAIGEGLLDHAGRGGDPAFGGCERATGKGGDVFERLPLDVAKRPGDALIGRQRVEHTIDASEERAVLAVRPAVRNVFVSDRGIETEHGAHAALAEPLPRGAYRDAREPAADGAGIAHAL